MVNVIITGLPYNLRVHKFIDFLVYHIFQDNVKITVNYVCHDGDMAKLSLSMRSFEARKVVRFLDGYEFTSRRLKYPLRCWREDGPSDLNNADDSQPLPNIQLSLQNPSNGSDELQAINRQIQLIKKQRILIEEESKLLIEKKRLEMIQSLGPNDFEKLCMLNQNTVVQPSESLSTLMDSEPQKLPEFIGPCKLIFGEMREMIKSKVDKRYDAFMKLLRVQIRKRLVLALKDKAYMSSKEIIAFYRSLYPKESDEELIKELLEEVLNDRTNSNQADTEELNSEALATDINPSISKPVNGNEEMVFYEDIYTDFEDSFKLDAGPIHNEVKTAENAQTNDEGCGNNEINEKTDEDEKSFEYESKVPDEVPKDGNDGDVSSEKAVESELVEALDIENDLDDWIEDNKEKEKLTETAMVE